ncbi:phosphotransferase [Paenibacillus sp. MMS20-IR301]|uniref:phosphotransferase enzyme family protein n=1 Tax=Paenibacillus sp. MMS20-IR301 TaxID=2895946 RepID=UPI0028EBB42F|nr:phosphotransferase [Paenibacillus sp. MMS20-IR301]WNS45063.1 phosphotransferase [Paenibacillus sp. MMS20-IR301]
MDQQLIEQVLAMLQIESTDYRLIGGYCSNVFEVGAGRKLIVKILDNAVALETSTLAEMEWLACLCSQGIHVPRPVRILGQDYIKRINNGFYFIVYNKIDGLPVNPASKEMWNARLFERWGELLGQIHAASQAYTANHVFPKWNESKMLLQLEQAELHPHLAGKWLRYVDELNQMKVSTDRFGLIHGDLHHGNLLINDNVLSVIDFGDCEYHWYAYDVAIVMYHTAQTVGKSEREQFIQAFCNYFMKGYVRGNPGTDVVQDLNYFIQYRHLYSFTYHMMYADKSQLSRQQAEYLQAMEASLLKDEPYLNLILS